MIGLEWQRRFLDAARGRHLSPRTVSWYEWQFKAFKDHGVDLANCNQEDLLRLVDYYAGKSTVYAQVMLSFVKRCLIFLERKDLVDSIMVPRDKDRAKRVQDKLLTAEEIKKLIEGAPTLQDRLLIEILNESGARRGELHNLRIKDVQFDEYSAILTLSGKSGTRTIRVYSAIPDLREHLNNHPEKDNPGARLFHFGKRGSSDFVDYTLYKHVQSLGVSILGRPIHPHQFRHTRATMDSKHFTDRELMVRYGWTQPDMVNVYSHLSGRDVDDKDLVLHGLKSKEEILRPIVQIQKCLSCGEENAPVAVYCHKCGKILTSATEEKTKQLIESQAEEMQRLKTKIEEISDQLEDERTYLDMAASWLTKERDPTRTQDPMTDSERAYFYMMSIYRHDLNTLEPQRFEEIYGFKPEESYESLSPEHKDKYIELKIELPDLRKQLRHALGELLVTAHTRKVVNLKSKPAKKA